MVFSSIPVYLDPPNWPQQLEGGGSENPQLSPPVPPHEGGGTASVRPGSMTERARLAKLPQPETAMKCPRCESTNTKFCYFNNYSLSQPRHFCKTCRRYWTRGGALRNVPVGGGCRRNKKSKGSRSKSPVTAERQGGGSSIRAVSSKSCTSDMIRHLPPPPPQLPFLPSLNHFSSYGAGDVGLAFGGIQPPVVATGGGGGIAEQWRMQQMHQFPFLVGLEQPPAGVYQFEGEGAETLNYMGGATGQFEPKALDSGVGEVKMEENQRLNLSRNFLGIPGNDQYWGSNGWNDLSGFTSSSTTHLF